MALTQQSVDGRLTDNSVRLIRQELALGGLITREDAAALVAELQLAREQAQRLAGEKVRLAALLDDLGAEQRANLADAFNEGWNAGATAVLNTARGRGLVDAFQTEELLHDAGHLLTNPHEAPQLQEVPD